MQSVPLGHVIDIAAQVLDLSRADVRRVMNIPLAESALNAPYAGFGEYERYPTLAERAAVLCSRLARNHCLPDGNKRLAYLSMIEYIERNGGTFDDSDQDDIADTIEQLAASELSELMFTGWVVRRIRTTAIR